MTTTRRQAALLATALLLAPWAAACDSGLLQGGAQWVGEGTETLLYGAGGDRDDERLVFDAEGLGPMIESEGPLTRVGLMWDAEPATVLEARFGESEQGWGPWQPVVPMWSEGVSQVGDLSPAQPVSAGPVTQGAPGSPAAPGRAASQPAGPRSRYFQLRLVEGPEPLFVRADRVALVGAEEGGEPEAYGSIELGLTVPGASVVSRAGWGASGARCSYGSHSPNRITIHHTDTPNNDSLAAPARLRQIQEYHTRVRGYCDIAYHFLVDSSGTLYQGRLESKVGSHVANNNTGNVGISLLGNYNTASPSAAQLASVSSLVAALARQYGIVRDRAHVKGHRQYRGGGSGDCPGDRLYARISDLLAEPVAAPDDDGSASSDSSEQSCFQGGIRGTCQATGQSCAGSYQPNLCPGDRTVQCCLPPVIWGSCSADGKQGSCQETSSSCGGGYQKGLCPGPTKVQCCLN